MISNNAIYYDFFESSTDSSEDTSSFDEDDKNSTNEFNPIESTLSISNQNKHRHSTYSANGIKGRCRSAVQFIKGATEEVLPKNIPLLWKRRRKEYIILNMQDIRRVEKVRLEKEYYTREHDKIFKPPKESTAAAIIKNKNEREIDIEKALDDLRKKSKRKVSELKKFVYTIRMPPLAGRPVWDDAPLAIKCCCPTQLDSCICKGNTLYAKRVIPFASYIKPPKNKCLYKIIGKFGIINTKKAGTFVPNCMTNVRLENQLYKSPEGKLLVQERGPEFCFSHCYHFFKRDGKENRQGYLAKMEKIKNEMVLQEMPEEKEEEPVIEEVYEEEIIEQVEEEEDEMEDEEEEKGPGISSGVKDEYYIMQGTMTDNDEIGDLIEGEYSHLLFGSCDYTHLKDISGICLEITNYNVEPKPPRSMFDLESIFHMKALKKSISSKIESKVNKIKKDFITSVFELQERYINRETQFDCNDIPGSGAVCESLVDAIRRHREKIKALNLKNNPLETVITKTEGIQDSISKDNPQDSVGLKAELLIHSNLAKLQHSSESNSFQTNNEFTESPKSSNIAELQNKSETYSEDVDGGEIETADKLESKLPEDRKPISPWYPCRFCKENSDAAFVNKIKATSEPVIKKTDTENKDITKSLQEATKSTEEKVPIQPWQINLESRVLYKKTKDFSVIDISAPESEDNKIQKEIAYVSINDSKSKQSKISLKSDSYKERIELPETINEDSINIVKGRNSKRPVLKKNNEMCNVNIDKKLSLLRNKSKTDPKKKNQSIVSESETLKIGLYKSLDNNNNNVKDKVDLQDDLPCTTNQMKELDMKKIRSKSREDSINQSFEKLTSGNDDSNNIFKPCIRDVYKNSNDLLPPVLDDFSKASAMFEDDNKTILNNCTNENVKLDKIKLKEKVLENHIIKSNRICIVASTTSNKFEKSNNDLNNNRSQIVSKPFVEINEMDSNIFNTMKDEEQIIVENYSSTVENEMNKSIAADVPVIKEASEVVKSVHELKVSGILLKESKANSRIIQKPSIKNYDVLEKHTFHKSRRLLIEKQFIDDKSKEKPRNTEFSDDVTKKDLSS